MFENNFNHDHVICQHKHYCALLEGACTEANHYNKCRMKETSVEEMPLIQTIKDRVHRDNTRDGKKKMC